VESFGAVPQDLRSLLLVAVRVAAAGGPHAEAARQVVLCVLVAQMLASAGHEGPPHRARRVPRERGRGFVRGRPVRRGSMAGRRPRG
jgi:hypothetical protein